MTLKGLMSEALEDRQSELTRLLRMELDTPNIVLLEGGNHGSAIAAGAGDGPGFGRLALVAVHKIGMAMGH